MSKKTFLYARVSTDQQSTGLEAQVRALKEYCSLNRIEDFELFADEGISGTKSSRPAPLSTRSHDLPAVPRICSMDLRP